MRELETALEELGPHGLEALEHPFASTSALAEFLLESLHFPDGCWTTNPVGTKDVLVNVLLGDESTIGMLKVHERDRFSLFAPILAQTFDSESDKLALSLFRDFRHGTTQEAKGGLRGLLLIGGLSLSGTDMLYESPCLRVLGISLALNQIPEKRIKDELSELVLNGKIHAHAVSGIEHALDSMKESLAWLTYYKKRAHFTPSHDLEIALKRFLESDNAHDIRSHGFTLLARRVDEREWSLFKLYSLFCSSDSDEIVRLRAASRITELNVIQKDVFAAYRREELERKLEYGCSSLDREFEAEQIVAGDILSVREELYFLYSALHDPTGDRRYHALELLFEVSSLSPWVQRDVERAVHHAFNRRTIALKEVEKAPYDLKERGYSEWASRIKELELPDESFLLGESIPPLLRYQTGQYSLEFRKIRSIQLALDRTFQIFDLLGVRPHNEADFKHRISQLFIRKESKQALQELVKTFIPDLKIAVEDLFSRKIDPEEARYIFLRVCLHYLARDYDELQGKPMTAYALEAISPLQLRQTLSNSLVRVPESLAVSCAMLLASTREEVDLLSDRLIVDGLPSWRSGYTSFLLVELLAKYELKDLVVRYEASTPEITIDDMLVGEVLAGAVRLIDRTIRHYGSMQGHRNQALSVLAFLDTHSIKNSDLSSALVSLYTNPNASTHFGKVVSGNPDQEGGLLYHIVEVSSKEDSAAIQLLHQLGRDSTSTPYVIGALAKIGGHEATEAMASLAVGYYHSLSNPHLKDTDSSFSDRSAPSDPSAVDRARRAAVSTVASHLTQLGDAGALALLRISREVADATLSRTAIYKAYEAVGIEPDKGAKDDVLREYLAAQLGL